MYNQSIFLRFYRYLTVSYTIHAVKNFAGNSTNAKSILYISLFKKKLTQNSPFRTAKLYEKFTLNFTIGFNVKH